MKVSLNWIKQFTDITLEKEELIERIGRQLGEIEEVIDWGSRYQDIVVAEIVEAADHPDADKLGVYQIDYGKSETVQVVAGDKTLSVGDKVAWLPPGSHVPSTYDTEPLKLEARKLRGEMSNGMLGSAAELAIGSDYEGVLKLDTAANNGTALTDVYELDDTIIDIENKMFTHRPDCFGVLGVARELAGIQGLQFTSPQWYLDAETDALPNEHGDENKLPLIVKNEAEDAVPRFMAVAMSGLKVHPSPLQMQSYLMRVGIKPINNVVDITNYIMYLTGQPLHAYDYDKVQAKDNRDQATLLARQAKKGETLTLINEKTITLASDDIVIATNEHVIGLGGVMGGIDTEVDNETKRIILECANFDLYAIRRTSMRNGIFSDAVTRFNKGQSPHQNDKVIVHTMDYIKELAGGHSASPLYDETTELSENPWVTTTADFINARLGLDLSTSEIVTLLQSVEFNVENNEQLRIQAPFWRTDIEIPEDIVEEVGRLRGYDTLPLELPRRRIAPATPNSQRHFQSRVRSALAAMGANEVLTYSFVHGNVLEVAGQETKNSYRIKSALSPDLQYYRQSLTPSLLTHVHANIKAGYSPFALFEIGTVHHKQHPDELEPDLPKEWHSLSFVCTAEDQQLEGAAFYQARTFLQQLGDDLGVAFHVHSIEGDSAEPVAQAWGRPFDEKRAAAVYVGDAFVGYVGEYRAELRRAWKLPTKTAGFELEMDTLLMNLPQKSGYRMLSRFPQVQQDISLRVDSDITYQQLHQLLSNALETEMFAHTDYTFSPLDIYQPEDDYTIKQYTFRLTLASHERTLKAEEVNSLLDRIAKVANNELGAKRL